MSQITVQTAGVTDVGRRRDHNEDQWTIISPDDGGLVLVVADGMGGHLAGEVASEMAVETLTRELASLGDDPTGALKAAIERANYEIWRAAEADPQKQGMGTTIVAAVILNGTAYLANAGDSPAYLVRARAAEQVTDDHGLVAEQVRAGLITEEDAEHHPFRHMLTRCLGVDEHVEVQTYGPRALEPGDVLLLCSDGLTEHVKRSEVGELAGQDHGISPEDIARTLIHLANERGGHDNITVVVGRVE
ncbi:MAG: Stp1/IreP family PP2C-type Ser/Thr phosphatase [Chloroflexi bacterium]|nr:Stp1/IreP family PP2C-type Ser/Thr phosphatase [Chloroflexota bacterium]